MSDESIAPELQKEMWKAWDEKRKDLGASACDTAVAKAFILGFLSGRPSGVRAGAESAIEGTAHLLAIKEGRISNLHAQLDAVEDRINKAAALIVALDHYENGVPDVKAWDAVLAAMAAYKASGEVVS